MTTLNKLRSSTVVNDEDKLVPIKGVVSLLPFSLLTKSITRGVSEGRTVVIAFRTVANNTEGAGSTLIGLLVFLAIDGFITVAVVDGWVFPVCKTVK